MHRLHLVFAALSFALAAVSMPAQAAIVDAYVTSSADSGPGTLRQAILDANANDLQNNGSYIHIQLANNDPIELASSTRSRCSSLYCGCSMACAIRLCFAATAWASQTRNPRGSDACLTSPGWCACSVALLLEQAYGICRPDQAAPAADRAKQGNGAAAIWTNPKLVRASKSGGAMAGFAAVSR